MNFPRLLVTLGTVCIGLLLALPAHADWDKIKSTGTLKVAVYKEFAPFSSGAANSMAGIDVDLAKALAQNLGLKLTLLPFDAGDDMRDDLRNMVWKGHYLGYGPADVMLHVPVDVRFMRQNEQVFIFAPYYRETTVLAHDLSKLPQVTQTEDLKGVELAAEQGTAAASALAAAEGGLLRDKIHMMPNAQVAVQMLRNGQVAAVYATRAQIESELPQNTRR